MPRGTRDKAIGSLFQALSRHSPHSTRHRTVSTPKCRICLPLCWPHCRADGKSPVDEELHLTGAIQYCGFRRAVGTIWAIADVYGPDLAGNFGVLRQMARGVVLRGNDSVTLGCSGELAKKEKYHLGASGEFRPLWRMIGRVWQSRSVSPSSMIDSGLVVQWPSFQIWQLNILLVSRV